MNALPPWAEIEQQVRWGSLLVGNGASRAIWDGFSYSSLFEAACLPTVQNHLTPEAQDVFQRLGTRNFEQVLSRLLIAAEVSAVLGLPDAPFMEQYQRIKDALAAAVHHVHIPWDRLPNDVLIAIGDALSRYSRVYSTNYDIVIYWAAMQMNARPINHKFKDYFWTRGQEETTEFHISDAEVWGENVTGILYLHGALHLVRTIDGGTHKVCNHEGARVLDRFGEPMLEGAVPLVVSEGDSSNKLASIEQSSYLSHALAVFSFDHEPLVILGHSLGSSDDHLVKAIDQGFPEDRRRIAIGLHPEGGSSADQERHFRARLETADLVFFDARTHPLTRANLHQDAPEPGSLFG